MCLDIIKETIRTVEELFKDTNVITCWKLVDVDNQSKDIYVSSPFFPYEWKKGINVSDREEMTLTKREKRYGEVNRGFHVFLSEKDAEDYRENTCFQFCRLLVVIPVLCKKEHFVAGGLFTVANMYRENKDFSDYPSAVFTQVEVTQEDYDNTQKEIME